jgi:hypothetical protein
VNVIGWWCRQRLLPANQVAFFSVRSNKWAQWKTGLSFYSSTWIIINFLRTGNVLFGIVIWAKLISWLQRKLSVLFFRSERPLTRIWTIQFQLTASQPVACEPCSDADDFEQSCFFLGDNARPPFLSGDTASILFTFSDTISAKYIR